MPCGYGHCGSGSREGGEKEERGRLHSGHVQHQTANQLWKEHVDLGKGSLRSSPGDLDGASRVRDGVGGLEALEAKEKDLCGMSW